MVATYQKQSGDCAGNNIGQGYTVKSIAECQTNCDKDPKCMGFSNEGNNCINKSKACSGKSLTSNGWTFYTKPTTQSGGISEDIHDAGSSIKSGMEDIGNKIEGLFHSSGNGDSEGSDDPYFQYYSRTVCPGPDPTPQPQPGQPTPPGEPGQPTPPKKIVNPPEICMGIQLHRDDMGIKAFQKQWLKQLCIILIFIIINLIIVVLFSTVIYTGGIGTFEFFRNYDFLFVFFFIAITLIVLCAIILFLGRDRARFKTEKEYFEYMKTQMEQKRCNLSNFWVYFICTSLPIWCIYSFFGPDIPIMNIIIMIATIIWIFLFITTYSHTKNTCSIHNECKAFGSQMEGVVSDMNDKYLGAQADTAQANQQLEKANSQCISNTASAIGNSERQAQLAQLAKQLSSESGGANKVEDYKACESLLSLPNVNTYNLGISAGPKGCYRMGNNLYFNQGDAKPMPSAKDGSSTKTYSISITPNMSAQCGNLKEALGSANFIETSGYGPSGCFQYGDDLYFNTSSTTSNLVGAVPIQLDKNIWNYNFTAEKVRKDIASNCDASKCKKNPVYMLKNCALTCAPDNLPPLPSTTNADNAICGYTSEYCQQRQIQDYPNGTFSEVSDVNNPYGCYNNGDKWYFNNGNGKFDPDSATDWAKCYGNINNPQTYQAKGAGLDCGGNNLPNGSYTNVESAEACKNYCNNAKLLPFPGCQGFSYDPSSKQCILKEAVCSSTGGHGGNGDLVKSSYTFYGNTLTGFPNIEDHWYDNQKSLDDQIIDKHNTKKLNQGVSGMIN